MSINSTSGVNFSSIAEEIKERGNNLPVVSVRDHTYISNSVSPSISNSVLPSSVPQVPAISSPNEPGLSDYPQLQSIVTLSILTDPKIYNSFPATTKIGNNLIVFNRTNFRITTLWAGAILDEFGLHSRSLGVKQELQKADRETYAWYTLKSKNASSDCVTGSGLRGKITKPVFGISDIMMVNNTPKLVIQSLIVNDSEKRVVLTMISVLKDIEDAFATHLRIPPLVDIVQSYCDWTDTGLEKRQASEKMNDLAMVSYLITDRIFARAAVREPGLALNYAIEVLRSDGNIALAAINR